MKFKICIALLSFFYLVYSSKDDMSFYLYQRPNADTAVLLDPSNPLQINATKKIVFYTHGILSNASETTNLQLKDAYLKRYDCNFILTDWYAIAHDNFFSVVDKTPHLGKQLGQFLCTFSSQLKIELKSVHLVGHSTGAHISGLAGQFAVEICNEQLGRISGLDPAGPIFQTFPPDKRLDASDAAFVDVVHTNELLAGYFGNCGHVDFYANCGTMQPGCFENISGENFVENLVACSHVRAFVYWLESVNSDNFIAQSCDQCPWVCKEDKDPDYVVMGENCQGDLNRTVYWIPTNKEEPFAAECSLYPSGCS